MNKRFAKPHALAALLAVLLAPQMAGAACGAGTCLAPSQSQAEALFGRIEAQYPQLFAPAAITQSLQNGSDTAFYRRYANPQSTGLATYQGGLWYAVGASWQRYSSLDEGNRQFCGGTCFGDALTYPIVDTGQSRYYNTTVETAAPSTGQAFYGEDAQYAGAQPSYALSGDGKTVRDNVTGLTWMRGPNTTLAPPLTADKKTYSGAQAWVATVNAMSYGGYVDWRLPSIKELYSLMNFAGTDPSSYSGTDTSVLTPFIDTRYFNFGYGEPSQNERIIDAQYASSTVFAVNPAETGAPKLFGLNLADGRIKGYDLATPGGGEKTFFVQLVRGTAGYGANSYTDNGDGTVSDAATGLTWSKADSGSGMTWQEALAWVQAKNAANHLGHNDWRLPNAKELHSLVNYANAPDYNGKPAIDTAYFDSTAITNENGDADYPYYWTSTTHTGYAPGGATGSYAVYIPFGRALGWPSGAARWVDIHGAGCQRSDPKLGPPYGYATAHTVIKNGVGYTGYAHGPQGDALRGKNFVRLVR